LARRQAGVEDETVEAVILDPAGPHGDHRLLKPSLDSGGDRGQEGDPGELEFMDPHRRAAGTIDLKRLFGDDAQTKILKNGQHIGKCDRLISSIEAQPR